MILTLNSYIVPRFVLNCSCSTKMSPSLFMFYLLFSQYIRPFDQLTSEEVDFLDGRYVCCDGSCTCANGLNPVNCFVSPCSYTTCPSGTTCIDNYCGGCNVDCAPNSPWSLTDEIIQA